MFTCPSTDAFPVMFFRNNFNFLYFNQAKPTAFEVNNPTEELFWARSNFIPFIK